MSKLTEFVSEHISDNIAKLILNKHKWPEIDMETAVNCIESRRKLKGKVQEWYDNQYLIFPLKLSAEQCSSSATGHYKSSLAAEIAGKTDWKIADLTGGLGVDSWFFSKRAAKVLYNEMQTTLCNAARHNFKALNAENIHVSNHKAEKGTIAELLNSFIPDIIYMDPARRGEGGRKVFLLEECTPDVLTLKEEIFSLCRHILIKLSPMADISMICERLGRRCREVHIVSSEGECKELLIWMDREWDDAYSVTTVEIRDNSNDYQRFTFSVSEESEAVADIVETPFVTTGLWLFEPGKALMKSGAFNLISTRFSIGKLGRSTHYYIIDEAEKVQSLKSYGKVYKILRSTPLDKRTIKAAAADFPKAEVTARNIPMDTETLRRKLSISSGDSIHIFGLRSDTTGNILMITKRN